MGDQLPQTIRDALQERALEALGHWSALADDPVLLKYRENAVFRITLADGRSAALRLHRPGYHDETSLRSELDLMAALRFGGLDVPCPVPTGNGQNLICLPESCRFPEQYADVVSWVDGAALGQSGTPLSQPAETQADIFFCIGHAMATMHDLADAWALPADFRRPAWDAEGLLGEKPLWGRFWDCPGLSRDEASALSALRDDLRHRLANAQRHGLDYGLIHADLVRENIFLTGDEDRVAFIDFDDAGYGFLLFDLATALLKNRQEPAYPAIENALITGYRSRRGLSDAALECLPLFMVLRSLTYIGWLAERPEIPNAAERLSRYVAESLELARKLDTGA
ncbi:MULTISPECIES: homoserine kinase [unclassified Rhizobium]|jgi:Ser/Thr protein kinase RdoA (MazF antagonist)|uniref:homoserine kinase n=1 Tax=unclassified Rhizobium TaxID=2613769 RepID=UPI001A99BF45|nr:MULTISPECIES: homoserine kinase [unclassified Rhizobium]MBX5156334.1 homoserine kinase [Rhizobium sp. NZLR8]MBX5162463.1 homoserine kinase [Rhizobium sp. NZLR4b]MBX5185526.1 homoserine kinase [Rhizobium sp. NZLR5]MBX5198595.1 homoserine kinase [Rhizobium sp. NZLR10]MBX5200418.1 homoserine kinase [Rhizobium sp. NZLR1]